MWVYGPHWVDADGCAGDAGVDSCLVPGSLVWKGTCCSIQTPTSSEPSSVTSELAMLAPVCRRGDPARLEASDGGARSQPPRKASEVRERVDAGVDGADWGVGAGGNQEVVSSSVLW